MLSPQISYDVELQNFLKITGLQASDLVKSRTKKKGGGNGANAAFNGADSLGNPFGFGGGFGGPVGLPGGAADPFADLMGPGGGGGGGGGWAPPQLTPEQQNRYWQLCDGNVSA